MASFRSIGLFAKLIHASTKIQASDEKRSKREMEDLQVAHAQPDHLEDDEDDLQYISEDDPLADNGDGLYEDAAESEESEEGYVEVSDTAREEMTKLEKIFQRKGLKFRMIGRIGEGTCLDPFSISSSQHALTSCLQALSLLFTKQRTCITTFTRMTGTLKPWTAPHGPRHQ